MSTNDTGSNTAIETHSGEALDNDGILMRKSGKTKALGPRASTDRGMSHGYLDGADRQDSAR